MPAKKSPTKKTTAKKDGKKKEDIKFEPALWRYIQVVYQALKDKARLTEVDEGRKEQVFNGVVTGIFSEHRIPSPYYGPAMKFLKTAEKITVVRRGNSHVDSMIVIHDAPTRAEYDEWDHGMRLTRGTKRNKDIHELEQRVKDMGKRLGGIDLLQFAKETEKTLTLMKRELRALKAKVEKEVDKPAKDSVSSTQSKSTGQETSKK